MLTLLCRRPLFANRLVNVMVDDGETTAPISAGGRAACRLNLGLLLLSTRARSSGSRRGHKDTVSTWPKEKRSASTSLSLLCLWVARFVEC